MVHLIVALNNISQIKKKENTIIFEFRMSSGSEEEEYEELTPKDVYDRYHSIVYLSILCSILG